MSFTYESYTISEILTGLLDFKIPAKSLRKGVYNSLCTARPKIGLRDNSFSDIFIYYHQQQQQHCISCVQLPRSYTTHYDTIIEKPIEMEDLQTK
mmetsp:Transcript_28600/g.32876  ORF Transcript_28600/g.32876 Transcript_28600/m.32876 type:complete len:95 (-) Transcript_28600:63-347(-)